MKIETIKARLQKAEEKAIKINGTLERHNKQLEKKAKVLTNKGIDLNTLDKFQHCKTEAYWDICEYESKQDDIKSNVKKLNEVNKTISDLNELLIIEENKLKEINSISTEILNEFLENWKQKCLEYYTNLANEFIALKNKEYEITKEELEKVEYEKYDYKQNVKIMIKEYTAEQIENILNTECSEYDKRKAKNKIKNNHIRIFNTSHFASDMFIITKILDYDIIDIAELNKILDNDVIVKKEMFISRIKEVVGNIENLNGLIIGINGEINGIAEGEKGKAKVETIGAGGYNIQCYHFRVLVNKIK